MAMPDRFASSDWIREQKKAVEHEIDGWPQGVRDYIEQSERRAQEIDEREHGVKEAN